MWFCCSLLWPCKQDLVIELPGALPLEETWEMAYVSSVLFLQLFCSSNILNKQNFIKNKQFYFSEAGGRLKNILLVEEEQIHTNI